MEGTGQTSSTGGPGSPFPTTRWTLVQQAAQGDPEAAAQALRELCVLYRDPIHVWLRRHGPNLQDAEDLTHGFVVWLLSENRLAANPNRPKGKGRRGFQRGSARFRSFLLECLQGYLHDLREKAKAAKRGGGAAPAETEPDEIADTSTADPQHDVDFARTVHRRTLERLLAERYAQDPKRLQRLRGFILGRNSSVSYAEVGAELGLKTGAVKKAVFDLRDAYSEIFREEILETTAREDVAEEMRYLLTLLARADPPEAI
jgi:DNA-directed RNA polymerase specialized sigma24 family protein